MGKVGRRTEMGTKPLGRPLSDTGAVQCGDPNVER